MATYSKTAFRESRRAQYKYFRQVLYYSILGIVAVLVFLMIMLRFVWS